MGLFRRHAQVSSVALQIYTPWEMEPRPRPSASPPCSDSAVALQLLSCSARACGVHALEPLDLKKRHACVGGDGEGVGARLLLVLVHLSIGFGCGSGSGTGSGSS